jgi:DNA repair protein RadC
MEREIKQDWSKVSEVELIYRSKIKASERPRLKDSKDVYRFLLANWDLGKIELCEEFKVLYLNQANKVLGIFTVSQGGITGTVADTRIIFITALKLSAIGLILSHSHPSGNLTPSRADEELTSKIKQAGQFLDIKVIDHLIVTKESYYSFADEGLL